jgi:hypothetical protein
LALDCRVKPGNDVVGSREPNIDPHVLSCKGTEDKTMRGLLLLLLGISIPVIVLLYLFHVI